MLALTEATGGSISTGPRDNPQLSEASVHTAPGTKKAWIFCGSFAHGLLTWPHRDVSLDDESFDFSLIAVLSNGCCTCSGVLFCLPLDRVGGRFTTSSWSRIERILKELV